METPQRIWHLKIDGKRMEGALTVPTNNVFRRVTLTRD